MSSNDVAVSVQGISKSYQIAHQAQNHTTLGEALIHRLKKPFERPEKETFWALKDVSFDIKKGEIAGIIGRNGAGKSTLLKILSQITEPTAGEVQLYGRVGSLLEVGTGFHPELTGRENIYLNGAILGMQRREITKHFDEIVDFAEVESFLDTPVKRYSSGMYVRLAFAVAAHLNPSILIVDEVLAVGDSQFQKKCLGKMHDVASRYGRTVLFVSHNMDAVRALCTIALLLQHGRLLQFDTADKIIEAYVSAGIGRQDTSWERGSDEPGSPLVIERVEGKLQGQQPEHILNVTVELRSHSRHRPAFIALDVLTTGENAIMQALPTLDGFITDTNSEHKVHVSIHLPPLIPGRYLVSVWVGDHNTSTLDYLEGCIAFEISQPPTEGRTYPYTTDHGYIVPCTTWDYQTANEDELTCL